MDRQQLHRGHAQASQMLDCGRMGQPGEGAALFHWNPWVALSEALDVGFVQDRVGIGDGGRRVVAPLEVAGDHQATRHKGRRVEAAEPIRVARRVAEYLCAPGHVTGYRQRVWIEEQLVAVAAQAGTRLVWPRHAVPVALARSDCRDETMPDSGILLDQRHALLGTGFVEQAKLEAVGDVGRHGEVGAGVSRRGSQRERSSRPYIHSLDPALIR